MFVRQKSAVKTGALQIKAHEDPLSATDLNSLVGIEKSCRCYFFSLCGFSAARQCEGQLQAFTLPVVGKLLLYDFRRSVFPQE